MTDIINLNVGGVQHSVARDTIMKFEDTMLAKLVSAKWNSESSEAAIFIDRNGERFQNILDQRMYCSWRDIGTKDSCY